MSADLRLIYWWQKCFATCEGNRLFAGIFGIFLTFKGFSRLFLEEKMPLGSFLARLNFNIIYIMLNKGDKKIIKASGVEVDFDQLKLRASLQRAGASADEAESVVQAIEQDWHSGLTTKALYRRAYRMLRRYNKTAASRYSLKQALLALGPSGYPFETLVAHLLKADGFLVQKGVVQSGRCINHEVDIFANRGNKIIFGECKFRNAQQLTNDVKVVLYVRSRFEDLCQGEWSDWLHQGRSIECFVFMNTRYTQDALRYGECSAMKLVGWDTPAGNSLRDRVNRTGIHPLTCLSTLTKSEKTALIASYHLVLVQDLLQHVHALEAMGINQNRQRQILQEADALCFGVSA